MGALRASGRAALPPPACPRLLAGAQGAAHARSGRLWLAGASASGGASRAEVWHLQPVGGFGGAPACVHGAWAAAADGGVACSCDEGWGGAGCDVPVCDPPCGRHGTCDARRRSCVCDLGHYGEGCDRTNARPTALRHAARAMRSLETASAGRWSGPACTVPVCPDCGGRGACDAASGCCVCKRGFTGCDCSEPLPGRWEAVTPDASEWPRWSESTDATTCAGAPLLLLDGGSELWRSTQRAITRRG